MFLYISKLQFGAINAMQQMLAEEYGLKHPQQKQYLPIAFINRDVEFVFEDGKPVQFNYRQTTYGNFSFNKGDLDNHQYYIPVIDAAFLLQHPNIKIYYSASFCGIETESIKIFDSLTNKLIIDLSSADGSFIHEPHLFLEQLKTL